MAIGSLGGSEPTIEIEILGVYAVPTRFTCLIDTGFTGFLSIPLLRAFPIGLTLHSGTTVTFANGTTETRLVFLGFARIDGREESGLIIVEEQADEVILGMEFLSRFELKPLICPKTSQVELTSSDGAFVSSAALPAQHTPAPSPPEPPLSI